LNISSLLVVVLADMAAMLAAVVLVDIEQEQFLHL
jgi:hypothetical protein